MLYDADEYNAKVYTVDKVDSSQPETDEPSRRHNSAAMIIVQYLTGIRSRQTRYKW